MKPPIDFSKFPEIENDSAVSTLIELVEQQSVTIQQQGEVIQLLRDEIARLKGQKPKPKIKPSKLEKDPKKNKKSSSNKRAGLKKGKRQLIW
jgi:uncharacterized small protein (DUF1192 family)